MTAQELRIGNYISYFNDEVHKVTGIFTDGIHDEDYNGYEYDDIYPIPLTAEWLLKFGAKPRFQNTEFIHDRFRIVWRESYNYWYVIDTDSLAYITKVEFVHEWQNFIFILNDEELKLK